VRKAEYRESRVEYDARRRCSYLRALANRTPLVSLLVEGQNLQTASTSSTVLLLRLRTDARRSHVAEE
jgi:hypothetical protein